jgi:hypothetical protein
MITICILFPPLPPSAFRLPVFACHLSTVDYPSLNSDSVVSSKARRSPSRR